MMNKEVNSNRFIGIILLVWVYVVEATTFYIKSNRLDNLFQLTCIILMLIIVLAYSNGFGIKVKPIFFAYVLLLFCGILPDFFSGQIVSGLKVLVSFALPLMLLVIVNNIWGNRADISAEFFKIPVIYGVIISLQGIILELCNFLEIPIKVWKEDIGKTGNVDVPMCSIHGIPFGGYATWGTLAGKSLLRIQGFYIEPSKLAMFLIIPLFFSWGLYKDTKKKRYAFALVLCCICFLITMSRAGIIAVFSAIIIGLFFIKPITAKKGIVSDSAEFIPQIATYKDIKKLLFAVIIVVIVAESIVSGMVMLSKYYPNLEFLYVGISATTGKANLIRNETVDSSSIFSHLLKRPCGYGFSNTLHNSNSSVFDTNLANAFILWLVTGGVGGAIVAVIIVLILFLYYCIPCLKSENRVKNAIGLSYIGLMIHSLSYGTWMTPEYLLIVSIMLIINDKRISNM